MREYAAVVVPITVVLMPLPRAADKRFLGGELGLEVVDRAFEDLLHGVHHAGAARGHAIDAVAGAVPQRDARGGSVRVQTVEDMSGGLRVLLHGAAEEAGFLLIEHGTNDYETLGLEGG